MGAPGRRVSLIVFGLALWIDPLANLVSRFVQPMAASADRLAGAVGHESPAAALFFGGLLGLAWSPCAGPMLVSSLALVATGRDAGLGAAAAGPVRAGRGHAAGAGRLCVPRRLCAPEGMGPRAQFRPCATASVCWRCLGHFHRHRAGQADCRPAILAILPDAWLELITRF
jgi:hypothetical protein